jgi:Ca-activated chloride channel homolog
MKELFERHRAELNPEEDQKIWSRVEKKLSERRSFWQSWRFPVSMAATASAVLMVVVLTRGTQELKSVRVAPLEPPAPTLVDQSPIPVPSESREHAKDTTPPASPRLIMAPPLGREPVTTEPKPTPGKESSSFDKAVARNQATAGAPSEAVKSLPYLPPAQTPPPASIAPPAPAPSALQNGATDRSSAMSKRSLEEKGKVGALAGDAVTLQSGPVGEIPHRIDGLVAPVPLRKDDTGSPISVGGSAPVNGQPFDAMFFQHYGVNPFIDPEDDRYATFAVDVDNASYTLTRSYLERGALPPAEAVRVEEFVNAMRHDYPPPENPALADREWGPSEHGTFSINLEAAPSPFGPGLVLFRVGLKGKEIAPSQRKPANLTFVVDVSGSMSRENRLELVKRSLFELLDQMNDEDRIALVVFGTDARVLLPSTSLRHRRDIEDAIVRLTPEGSTNAEAGLRQGYAVADASFDEHAVNRIILCSDGVANVGLTDEEGILGAIGRDARRGIALSTIGVGMGNYNDVLMEKLADKGDGNYFYVDDLAEAQKVFVENLTGTLQTIAKQTKIQVEFVPSAVRRYRLLGYENRDVADKDFRNNAVDAGEVGAGHEVTALFEMKLDRNAARGPVATVRIRYEDPETGRVTEEARTLRAEDILSRVEKADPTFQLDASVAEFAEILRHSYWAKDGNLESARDLADRASRAMGSPKDAREVVSLIGTAEQLWSQSQPPRWQDDDVRPQWEPGQDNKD